MFKWLYNIFNGVFGGGTKGHTNITDTTGLTWDQALKVMEDGGWVRKMDWRADEYVVMIHGRPYYISTRTGIKYKYDGSDGNVWCLA